MNECELINDVKTLKRIHLSILNQETGFYFEMSRKLDIPVTVLDHTIKMIRKLPDVVLLFDPRRNTFYYQNLPDDCLLNRISS